MAIEMDAEIQRLAEFMQREFAAAQLVSMAENMAVLAPVLWGKYEREAKELFLFRSAHLQACDPHKLTARHLIAP